jgi:hypothetical protein
VPGAKVPVQLASHRDVEIHDSASPDLAGHGPAP